MRLLQLVTSSIVLSAGLSGCGVFSNGIVSLFTNRTDIAAYAEAFNSAQDSHRLEIHYREKPSESLDKEEAQPDLILSEYLAGRSSLTRFKSLNKLFSKGRLDRGAFYQPLLSIGQKDKQQVLIPVSFNLPIVMFDTRLPGEEISVFSLNVERIREIGAGYNKIEEDRYTAMGFSPRWDPDFLILYSTLFGTDFTEGFDSVLSFNERNLRASIEGIRDWSVKTNGGSAKETLYAEKYLYDPPYRQVSLGRAKFAYSSVADFFLLPENRRISLDFRWVAHHDKIPALDTILYAGVPVRAKNPKGAEAFLQWLLKPETQKALLEKAPEKTAHSFGIASGFSSLREVNEKEYPRYYPHLTGHIPPADSLSFPPPVAANWPKLKDQVIRPYLVEQTIEGRPAEPLSVHLKTWLLKQTE